MLLYLERERRRFFFFKFFVVVVALLPLSIFECGGGIFSTVFGA